MLFNSFEFLIFLPIVFGCYWALRNRLTLQNLFVVAASYIFYGWWDRTFLLLIAATTLTSWISGILIDRWRSRRTLCRSTVALNMVINLGVLCTYKYFDFFAGNLAAALSSIGIHLDPLSLGLILPVGISFYTLQALGYTIDVYRQKVPASHDPIAFFAFISFFPQLVAGPIERAGNLLPQFMHPRSFSYPRAVEGMQQILWGLFKKMVVADNCAKAVNEIFGNYSSLDGGILIWGAVFFSFQIYCDFSGYSDIAIGTAKLFGITLSRNFHFPYISRSIAEFWKRWHISLNTWFVDYVYIPLGGSRGSLMLTIANTMAIFLLSGLWHGANWTFICWGLFNALLFIPLVITGKGRKFKTKTAAYDSSLPKFTEALQILFTFILVTIGWIFFRSDSISDAIAYLTGIATGFSFSFPSNHKTAVAAIALLWTVEWFQRRREFGLQLPHSGLFRYRAARWAAYYIVFILILLMVESPEDFIYFQF